MCQHFRHGGLHERNLRTLTQNEKSVLVRAVSAVRELPVVTILSKKLAASAEECGETSA